MNTDYKGLFRVVPVLCIAATLLILYSCASIGNPTGGPRDEDPPRVIRTYPTAESSGFSGKQAYVELDELINVKDAFTNVVVSPPGASTPKVTASGRRVFVEWDNDLLPNTTYTVDFGSAIEDINENNKLGSFSLSFSTGETIDTLRVSGIVLDAKTLEPQQGMLVGLHPADAPDSALRTLRFQRATKTDEYGRFTIRGLKSIPYNIFALGDLNNDYRWDNPAELLAFYPSPVTPYSTRELTSDTIYNLKTGAVDTIVSRERTIFLPNNLLLSAFDTGYKSQYLVKYERPDSARLSFIFNTAAANLPEIRMLGTGENLNDHSIIEHSLTNDTITYWLTTPSLISTDTLHFAMRYLRTNQDQKLITGTDTLYLSRPKVKAPAKQKLNKQQQIADSIAAEKAKWISLSLLPGGTLDIHSPLTLVSPEPLVSINPEMIRLEQKVDTIYKTLPAPAPVQKAQGNVRQYTLSYPWEYGETYRLTVDSTAMTGVSGRPNATLSQNFTVKSRDSYSSLILRLSPDTIQGFVEILNSSDNPVASSRVENGIVHFPFLSPADYYARFTAQPLPFKPEEGDSVLAEPIDRLPELNSRLEFRTGNYEMRQQPDEVYYYPGKLSLKRHDRSEQWNLYGTPVDLQKPDAIKKNKPQTKSTGKSRKNNEQEETEEDEYFDVTRNPFDPKSNRRSTR